MGPHPNYYPFPSLPDRSNRIDAWGEHRLIEAIKLWLGPSTPPSPQGMGDDCAVLPPQVASNLQLFTTDSLTYGQHFDNSVGPQEAGSKLIKRNLSDIAAMGGHPGPALLNLLCGPDLSIAWLEQFIYGVRKACECYRVTIIGGDVSQLSPGHFTAALTLTGTVSGRPVLRSGASIGDHIYVTGSLGGSILGKHYDFEPRLREALWLSGQAELRGMMDLTDGLGKDLAALLPEKSSAAIDLKRIPISVAARTCAATDGESALKHAFCDGEDYELLFTLERNSDRVRFESGWRANFPELELSRIGQIIEAHTSDRYIDSATNQALPWQSGFEHFRQP